MTDYKDQLIELLNEKESQPNRNIHDFEGEE